LTNDVNLIDEECVVEALKNAYDYERAVERLDNSGKTTVMKLRKLAGDLLLKVSKKQKCKSFLSFSQLAMLREQMILSLNQRSISFQLSMVQIHHSRKRTQH
jgi:hypothetical protein